MHKVDRDPPLGGGLFGGFWRAFWRFWRVLEGPPRQGGRGQKGGKRGSFPLWEASFPLYRTLLNIQARSILYLREPGRRLLGVQNLQNGGLFGGLFWGGLEGLHKGRKGSTPFFGGGFIQKQV